MDYEKVAQNKSDRAALDGSVKEDQIELLKSAKSRDILYIQARQKNNGHVMKRLADILAIATRGIVADYKRPAR